MNARGVCMALARKSNFSGLCQCGSMGVHARRPSNYVRVRAKEKKLGVLEPPVPAL